MTHHGTSGLLDLAADLRETAPNVEAVFNLRKAARLMRKAAAVIERLAEHEPDLQVVEGEN